MRRNKSIAGDRRPQSDRKRLQEKFSNRINKFRIHSSAGKRSCSSNNHNSINNCSDINDVDTSNSFQYVNNTMPLQQDNLYQQPRNSQDDLQLILDSILALTPATAFVPMPNNDSTGIAHQTVPIFYPINTMDSLQDQAAIGIDHNSNQVQNGYTAFNQTVPRNIQQESQQHQHHHHLGNPRHPPIHYYSESSFFAHSIPLDEYGNQSSIHIPSAHTAAENTDQSPPPPPPAPVDATIITLPNTVPPSNQNFRNSDKMPTRPIPPSFPHGPKYFQVSESFRSWFSQVDADDSGFITLEELRTFLQNKDKTNFNDEAVLTIMDMFDNNKDNMIDSSEFPDMLAFIKNWESCFVYLDANKSGTIDYREMSLAIESLGFAQLSHRFILRLLKKYDCANNGQIDFDNFILACVTLCRCKETYEFMKKKFGSTGPTLDLEQFISSIIWPATNQ